MLIEQTITKTNIKIDFKVKYAKMGTLANSNKQTRFKAMEDYYDEKERMREEEKRRRK